MGSELSKAMVDLARQTLANTTGEVHHQRIETWQAARQVDLVVSRLALNYVEHLQPVFEEMYNLVSR